MQKASTTAIQVAGPPFDIADADIILRSSDSIDFHLYKNILTAASPIISDLLSLPIPKPGSNDEQNGVPIVCMAEDSHTLDLMLKICHPGTTNPPLNDIEDIKRVLHVSRKFELACACDIAAQSLGRIAREYSETRERAFAIAWAFELEGAVQVTARSTLRTMRPLTYHDEFAHVSAAAVFKLQDYQRICVDVAKAVAVHEAQWMRVGELTPLIQRGQGRKRCSQCAGPQNTASGMLGGYGGCMYLPEWFTAYEDAVQAALERRPCGAAVLETLVSSSIDAAIECESCKDHIVEFICVMEEYSRLLAVEVERRTLEVVVETPFE